MKTTVELTPEELKDIIRQHFGLTKNAPVTFHVQQNVDYIDCPLGGYSLSSVVVEMQKVAK